MGAFFAWLGDDGTVRLLEATTYIATIIGIPVAVALYARSFIAERQAREWSIYEAVQEKYMSFLEFAAAQPKVGVIWTERDILRGDLPENEQIIQDLLFDMLSSVFERAYLVYRRASTAQRQQQWAGWASYIDAYARRRNFQQWWQRYAESEEIINQYDLAFERYVNERIAVAEHNDASASAILEKTRVN
jgi:hypothetical protein